jgi:hypothetical protein
VQGELSRRVCRAKRSIGSMELPIVHVEVKLQLSIKG